MLSGHPALAHTALQGGLALADLAEVDLCYAPPYSSANDPLNLAAFVGMNDLSGKSVGCVEGGGIP